MKHFEFQTRQSEFGHLGAFVAITMVLLILLAYGHVFMASTTALINFLGNAYPVVLQRSHRMRIESMTKRSE